MSPIETYNELSSFCKDKEVNLVAVSKRKPNSAILELYGKGQRVFGENRVQELVEKKTSLPVDIQWHMIGHLQTNKVKSIAGFATMIQSGDRLSLLKEINKEAQKHNRTIDVLLQFKIAEEDTKYGWSVEDFEANLSTIITYTHINYRGVMGMATFTQDQVQVSGEFAKLKDIYEQIRNSHFSNKKDFDIISMGMSGDYKLAVSQGSTMIRVGSLLFGRRD